MKVSNFDSAYSRKVLHLAEILKVIAHPTRIQIIQLLHDKDNLSVTDIQDLLDCGCEQSMLSHHLNKMKDKGILIAQKNGKFKYYTLKDESIIKIIECLNNSTLL